MFFFFFFNDTATTEIYTLSLHDALPILLLDGIDPLQAKDERRLEAALAKARMMTFDQCASAYIEAHRPSWKDRKSTRLNSSHGYISYAVFCLKKKNITTKILAHEIDYYL